MRNWIDLFEAPITDLQWKSDDTDTSFGKSDKALLSSPKGRAKIIKAFEKTPFTFEVFFIDNNHVKGDDPDDNEAVDSYARKLDSGIHDSFWDIDGKPGVIRLIMMGNLSPMRAKMPMTGWALAHKVGHAIQDSLQMPGDKLYGYAAKAVKSVNKILNDIGAAEEDYDNTYSSNNFDYPAWFSEYLTMKSARDGKLTNGFETFAEVIAQYLIQGRITMELKNEKAQQKVVALNNMVEKLLKMCVGKVLSEV